MLRRGNPKVTGVLPVALGKATKIMPVVVHSKKEYVCVMELHYNVREEDLLQTLGFFEAKIIQRPPVRSSVRRILRRRRVYRIEYLERQGRLVLLKILCDPGTYMRKLCHDIGLVLQVGAHMRELRRVRTGPFTEKDAVTMHKLSESVYLWREMGKEDSLKEKLNPVEVTVCQLPKIIVKDTSVSAITHGAALGSGGITAYTLDVEKELNTALLTLRGELIGIGKPLVPQKEFYETKRNVVKPTRVIMEPNAYPIYWRKK